MSTQLTKYTSSDSGAPSIDGNAGSLISVLDWCLVTGEGWTHPVATSSNIASYQQPAGAGLGLVVNDNAPNGSAQGKEAWATGWESVAGVGSPVGSGTGQFPTPAQLLTSGHVVIRKSTATGTTARSWVVFADDRTFYLFISTGDAAGRYYGFMFGDIYSLSSSTDNYRVLINGRNTENSSTPGGQEGLDYLSALTTPCVGNFMPRIAGGTGTSITISKHGEAIKGTAGFFYGTVPYPNPTDNELYLSPIWVVEAATGAIRGRMRGLYMPCHAASNFTDGQTFTGAGDYAGRTFEAVKSSANAGVYIVETSATVEAN